MDGERLQDTGVEGFMYFSHWDINTEFFSSLKKTAFQNRSTPRRRNTHGRPTNRVPVHTVMRIHEIVENNSYH